MQLLAYEFQRRALGVTRFPVLCVLCESQFCNLSGAISLQNVPPTFNLALNPKLKLKS